MARDSIDSGKALNLFFQFLSFSRNKKNG